MPAKKIQKYFKTICSKEDAMLNIILELEVDENAMVITMWESTAFYIRILLQKNFRKI